ncbi:MAG TPA: dihydroorotate dehydrogenase electron transfer subunit [Clostridiales bacterium]|nr:dihydroorotate dehydrogenase electron transfer subunit [Clostridiales bacterium]
MTVEQHCTILEVTHLSSGAVSITFESKGMAAQITHPGQFVHVKCGEDTLLRRPISICNWSAERDLIRMVFEDRGKGTHWLSQRSVGETLDVLGPLGHGFQMDPHGRYLLVGGGIGVPPMLGCAVHGGEAHTAILGFRSGNHAMLLEDFSKACTGVRLATDDGSLGHHGFVDALVRQELTDNPAYTAVLACGPKPMLRSVAKVASEFGIPCQVSMEERMGCGVGACLVCACKTADGHYRHACKDGPVFPAEEVDWNE